MCHDRLSHLALVSIEYDILREIDFDKLIQDFARAKSRSVWSVNIYIYVLLYSCYDWSWLTCLLPYSDSFYLEIITLWMTVTMSCHRLILVF